MHCIDLAELAALLAEQAPAILMQRPRVDENGLSRYWVQSRQRIDHWHRWLGEYNLLENAGRPLAMQGWWNDHEAMIEEVLISEILTRVFAAFGLALDAVNANREIEPVTHSVYLSHLEARNRVLQLLLFGRGGTVDQTMKLNRLRRASERWNDRILAPLIASHSQCYIYAVDGNRGIAYANEYRFDQDAMSQSLAAALARSAMKSTLLSRLSNNAALPNSNREIAESIFSCLTSDCFDSVGLLKSRRFLRLQIPSLESQPSELHPIFPTVMPADHRKGVLPIASRWLA